MVTQDPSEGSVRSADGTMIAFDRWGSGPAVILVSGAADDGAENTPLATELAEHFTVYNYARRGRGRSGDTTPYAVEREVEDLAALVTEAGGAAHVYGVSSGGALALESAAAGVPISRLVVYEVPYDLSADAPQRHQEYAETLRALLAEGRRGDAFAHAMRLWGSSEEMIEGARQSSMWSGLEALAHTLAYDAAVLGDGRPPTERLATVTQPTLVLTGEEIAEDSAMAGLPPDFFGRSADAIAGSVPHAERRTVGGQQHVVEATTFAPEIARFLDR